MGGGLFLLTEALAASRFTPDYRYSRDFISSLGVPGRFHGFRLAPATSPLHALMNAGFIGEGLLFVAALVLLTPVLRPAPRRRRRSFAAGLANGVGLVLVGLFHAGGAARTDGTVIYHAIGAVLAIVGGNLAILWSPAPEVLDAPAVLRAYRRFAPFVGFAGVGLLLLFAALHQPDLLGLWERLGAYTIVGWELLFGGWLLLGRPWRGSAAEARA